MSDTDNDDGDLLDRLLTWESARAYDRALGSSQGVELMQRRDAAETAVRASLARIRAVVEALDAEPETGWHSPGEDCSVCDGPRHAVAEAHAALTPDDRRLLGMR